MPDRPSVLLTCAGKRYDIVAAFCEHAFTVVTDSSPLAPAQYAAHVRRAVPRIGDPGYVPALGALCEEFDVGAIVPLTDLDIEVLARSELPALVPPPETARRTYDKYECHLMLGELGLPAQAPSPDPTSRFWVTEACPRTRSRVMRVAAYRPPTTHSIAHALSSDPHC
jgi:hypothetical protein